MIEVVRFPGVERVRAIHVRRFGVEVVHVEESLLVTLAGEGTAWSGRDKAPLGALRGHFELRFRRDRASRLAAPGTVLIDKVAESRHTGYSAADTRSYVPAAAVPRGSLVGVVCGEPHPDGIICRVPEPAELS